MTAFLTIEQMKTHVFAKVRNAISAQDDTLMQDAIDSAIEEAKGYLSHYDVDSLFSSTNPDWKPNPALLNWVKAIAKWNFMALSNPNIDYDDAQIRYDQAIGKLKDIQSGKLVPNGWPKATPENRASLFQVHSKNPKRNNQFNGNQPNPYLNGY